MKKCSRAAALGIALLIALLIALSLWPQKRPITIPSTAVPWAIVDEGTPGVDANWREIITIVDVPCDPAGWRNVIIFELRDENKVVDSQELETGCQVVCDGQYTERCGEAVAPIWGSVPAGVYQVWYKPFWINEGEGIEVISYPPSITGLDDRQFKWFGEHLASSSIGKVGKIHLPIVMK